jgi:hypothetical protein
MSFGVGVLWLGIAWGWCPVGWCFRVVKDAHQEDALGAPCLDTVIVAVRSGTGVIRHFEITLRLATPDIRLASADAFAVVGGGCTGTAHGCKAKQGRRGEDGAGVWLLVPQ